MSTREMKRWAVMRRVRDGELSRGDAAAILALNYRQVRRIFRRFLARGQKGLVHGNVGRCSNHTDRKQARRMDCYQQFALAAAEMAMRDANFQLKSEDASRAAVVVGSCVGGLASAEEATIAARPNSPGIVSPFFILNVLINMASSHISIRFGFKGPNWSTNSACATSAHALGEAMRLIQRGEADVALAGGAEAPSGFMCIAGFNAIRALSTRNDEPARASRPFDADRDGFVLGEGAAILLLEADTGGLSL